MSHALSVEPGQSEAFSHLLVAADVHSWSDTHIAACGAEVRPDNGTAEESGEDPGYCPKCIRAAVRWIMPPRWWRYGPG